MSLWYAAHILMYVGHKEKSVTKVPLWENIVLIKADSEEEAFAKAQARGEKDAGDDDGTFHWGGSPAEWIFAGVRKLTLCDDPEKRPGDGTEISYLEMEVASEREIRRLLEGKPGAVTFSDCPESPKKQEALAGSTKNGVRGK